MQKKCKNISPRLREKILAETMEAGCVTAEIARKYGIRKERLYRWRGQHTKSVEKFVEKPKNNFVEAKIEDSSEKWKCKTNNALKKASLEFEGFTLTLEGSLKLSKMQQIIEILC